MSVEKLEPLGDRVLIELEPVAETTASGLYVAPSNQANKPARGTVVSVGTECEHLAEGDVVLISSNSKRMGVEIDAQDSEKEYFILREEQVVGVYR